MPKECKLKIEIKKPLATVFEFTTNPRNTPKWIASIVEEKASSFPPKVGTVYKNKSHEGLWNTYTVTACEPNALFELAMADNNYHVRYTYTPLNAQTTLLEYFEWVDKGTLETPFTQEILQKLKSAIEAD